MLIRKIRKNNDEIFTLHGDDRLIIFFGHVFGMLKIKKKLAYKQNSTPKPLVRRKFQIFLG